VSTLQRYDPALFLLERAESVGSALGAFILGVSTLGGGAGTGWVPIPSATFTLSAGYDVDDNGTLLVSADTGTVSLSFWDTPGATPLYPSDRVRASYAGETLFLGTVDTTHIAYAVDGEAARHGATRRVDFTATIAGTYAAALQLTICWTELPEEPAIDRIRRWITVDGWD
jgi:hypothetical protein